MRIPPLIKLCVPRKRHLCRICGQWIQKGEPCERWVGVQDGEGWWTCRAHPECLDYTIVHKWDGGDWESAYWESEMERPAEKRQCFMCRMESAAWIALEQRPRYVCSLVCFGIYANAPDLT